MRIANNFVYEHCKMEPFNFNELPEVVRQLFEKVERIEILLARLEPKEPDENEILNIEEAAQLLKVSVGALYTKVQPPGNPLQQTRQTAIL
ncbi:MAG: hypothetical protein JWQ84_1935 [Mucilaginibacter sp.]|nr:hypothetical protein [Mucilaginibacter sp.]